MRRGRAIRRGVTARRRGGAARRRGGPAGVTPRGWGRSKGPLRSFTAMRKEGGLFCGSFLRKGEVLSYVGLSQNVKDLKDLKGRRAFLRFLFMEGRGVGLCWALSQNLKDLQAIKT